MKKVFTIFLILIFGGTLYAGFLWNAWQNDAPKIRSIVNTLKEVESTSPTKILSTQFWNPLAEKSEKISDAYPFSIFKNIIETTRNIVHLFDELKIWAERSLQNQSGNINEFFKKLKTLESQVFLLEKNIDRIPLFLLPEEPRKQVFTLKKILAVLSDKIKIFNNLSHIFEKISEENGRILLLFQNQNEPRSTGGFIGSLLLLDVNKEGKIKWQFKDIYSIDRKIPVKNLEPAPDFFKPLSEKISLRDANFWPDFPTSAKKIETFFVEAQEKRPDIILGINLNLIKELFSFFPGQIKLPSWNIDLSSENFDMVLQFLVESKVAGKYNTKAPVDEFIKEIFSRKNISKIDFEKLKTFNFSKFLDEKNVLAYSRFPEIQEAFEHWNIDGIVSQKVSADNFLHFDFVSIGANKSERFMWTKIKHISDILPSGETINTISVERTHALKPNEILKILNTQNFPQNFLDLLTPELLWKLGAGQNRTMLRIFVPKNATAITGNSPSGEIKTAEFQNLKAIEVPLFVLPGEKISAKIKYKTKINRGNKNWRPYFLQLSGTPGRDKKTTFRTQIRTESNGTFTAETYNLGAPTSLIDQDFRAVVEF